MNLTAFQEGFAEMRRYDEEGDYEAAHCLEDRLARDVLTEIIGGNPDAELMAGALIDYYDKSEEPRWYA